MREFLEWVARAPRTYADAMSAWRSSCPRHCVWEDALEAGLVRVVAVERGSVDDAPVSLTARGRAVLAEWAAPAQPTAIA